MATFLVVLARCVLLLTLIAAPWAIGGADLPEQQWLFAGTLAAGVLAWLGTTLDGSARFSPAASVMLLLVAALVAIGAAQLAPHPHYPEFRNAELTAALQVLDGDATPATARSLYPAATRLQMARLMLALCAFLCGGWLFRERNARSWLWALLALNGVAVVAFGLVQRGSWNGRLYWSIPLELGGQPFAAFVNRNNAAEYLSLCVAGALGLWASRRSLATFPSPVGIRTQTRRTSPFWERIPATTWSILFLFLFGGVLATLSRGGALSALVAVLLVGVWSAAGGRARTLLLPLLGIVIAAGVWIALSQQGAALRDRLGSLSRNASSDGRLHHWNDMRGAIRDFPQLGTGLGTYRYANKPYESRKSESWFESADNQYLELIVDGGLGAGAIALLLLAAGAGLAFAWRRADCPGEALACGYPLIAIGLQSVTDCWWNTSANVLTLAVLAGALSYPERRPQSKLAQVEELLHSRRGLASAAFIGLCILVGSGLGLHEVVAAAKSTQFRRQIPDDEQRSELAELELDALVGSGEGLLLSRSDDSELHAALARLYYSRFRLQAVETLDLLAAEQLSEANRWDRTSPQTMFGTLARFSQIGDETALSRFREAPAVTENLRPMAEHVRAARRSCPILPHCGLFEALADELEDADPSIALRREAALSPARVKLLHSLALSAEMIGDDELFAVALAQCIAIDPDRTLNYVETARQRLSEPDIVQKLLPASPIPLLDFAEAARSPLGRAKAIERAFAAIADPIIPESERTYGMGRFMWLAGNFEQSQDQLSKAVSAAPEDPQRRWYYARALHSRGKDDEARRQLQVARQLAPRDHRFNQRIDELEASLSGSE